MSRSLLGAVLTLLVAIPPAEAAPVALRDDLAAAHVALAGPEVLVARELRDGRLELDAVALDGGARRDVLSLPAAPSAWRGESMLAASADRVGFVAEMRGRLGRTLEWRVYSGPPSGPLALVSRVRDRGSATWFPAHVDVDGDRLLLVEARERGRRIRARLLDSAAGLVPVAWAGASFAPVAIAGQHAAVFAADRDRRSRVERVALVDRVTGAEQAALPTVSEDFLEPGHVDLAAGGQIVAEIGRGLSITGPGEPPRVIPDSGRLDRPRFAGAGIAALETARSVTWPVLVAQDGTRRPLGVPTGYVDDVVADDRGVAWLANGCVRYAAVAGAPPPGPAKDPCPTTEIGLYLNNESRLRGRDVRVPVLCISAPDAVCRGTVLIKHRRRVVGRGRFAIPVGVRRKVEARLDRGGLELVRGRNPTLRIGARIRNGRIGPSRGVTELLVKVP